MIKTLTAAVVLKGRRTLQVTAKRGLDGMPHELTVYSGTKSWTYELSSIDYQFSSGLINRAVARFESDQLKLVRQEVHPVNPGQNRTPVPMVGAGV